MKTTCVRLLDCSMFPVKLLPPCLRHTLYSVPIAIAIGHFSGITATVRVEHPVPELTAGPQSVSRDDEDFQAEQGVSNQPKAKHGRRTTAAVRVEQSLPELLAGPQDVGRDDENVPAEQGVSNQPKAKRGRPRKDAPKAAPAAKRGKWDSQRKLGMFM